MDIVEPESERMLVTTQGLAPNAEPRVQNCDQPDPGDIHPGLQTLGRAAIAFGPP